jgi:hypothetical protein
MLRVYIRKLGQTAFWLSKWLVALLFFGGVVATGVVLLMRSDIDFDTFLNYFALGLLIFVLITLFYAILAIHDVPYDIAKHRNHPHQDAIHAAGWVSLFTLHAIWPFLWIWAMLYRPDRGWGLQDSTPKTTSALAQPVDIEELGLQDSPSKTTNALVQPTDIEELWRRVIELEKRSQGASKLPHPAEIEELRQRVIELEKRAAARVH